MNESGIKIIGSLNPDKDCQDRVRVFGVGGVAPGLRATDYKDPPKILGTIYTDVSEKYQRGLFPIARTVKAERHDLAVVEELKEIKVIGQMEGDYESVNRVYDIRGVSPTINTYGGGDRETKVIVAMRGRNPENPSDRTAGIETEQRLEPNSEGICNTLTSVQKDNLVVETEYQGILYQPPQGDRKGAFAILEKETSKAQQIRKVEVRYRIRKLTPRECWRLMDFKDADFDKAQQKVSNSQLYKQAGNSIVVNVLVAIMGQFFTGKENKYKEIND